MTEVDVAGRTVDVTNADKEFFPDDGITKGDVVEYYRRIGPQMLPWLVDRPLVMHRFPDGIRGDGFIQKQAPPSLPDWIDRAPMRHAEGTTDYVVCKDAATLVVLADLGCLVPHVWLSQVADAKMPDQIVVDLDPPGELDAAGVELVRSVALALCDLLAALEVSSFVKSSGSRGVHVHVPVDDCPSFDESRALALALARRVAADHPEAVTLEQRKADRGDRLYLDVQRNAYGQHAVAPYALRALPAAPVAIPLDWSEVRDKNFHPRRITIRNVFRRLAHKHDPWAELDSSRMPFTDVKRRVRELTGSR